MKQRRSILANPFAAELARKVAAKPKDHWQATVSDVRHGVAVSIRVCGRYEGPWERRRYVPSGGLRLIVSLDLPHYEHGSYHNLTRERHLKPGWTRESLARSLADLITRQQGVRATLLPLLYGREALHNATKGLSAEQIAQVEQIERDTGRTAVYTDMDAETLAFWRNHFGLAEAAMEDM